MLLRQQFWIAFAFSGWNAAAYAAEDFKAPRRDVPRAMLIGCGLVAVLYLVINWIFVTNLAPPFNVNELDRVTMAHLVVASLAGKTTATVLSALLVVYFVSAVSALTYIGPRVYSAMARDGFLPRILAARGDRPPTGSIVLQGALAIAILHLQRVVDALGNIGAVLVIFSALTVACLFLPRTRPKPGVGTNLAAALYLATSGLILYYGFKFQFRALLPWVGGATAMALIAYASTVFAKRGRPAIGSPISRAMPEAEDGEVH